MANATKAHAGISQKKTPNKTSKKAPVVEVLFPEFGNLAGDNGNAEYLKACLPTAEFIYTAAQDTPAFVERDVTCIMMNNMMETQQERALAQLLPYTQCLDELIQADVPMLFTGSAAEICGNSFTTMDGTKLNGLGLFSFAHEQNMPKRYLNAFEGEFVPTGKAIDTSKPSTTGEVGATSATDATDGVGATGTGKPITILGFHAQFTQLIGDNSTCYFAKAKRGWGNNTQSLLEGFRRHNCIATTLLGPLLPTNPGFCRWFLTQITKESHELAYEDVVQRAFQARLADFHAAPTNKEIEF